MFRWRRNSLTRIAAGAWLMLALTGSLSAQVTAPKVNDVPIPPNVDPFNLSFEDFKKYSSTKNFELLVSTELLPRLCLSK